MRPVALKRQCRHQHQCGATLAVSLVMLLVLTLFAVSGFNLSSVNLKLTGNYQRQISMETAAQQAIEQVISDAASFGPSPRPTTICINGGVACLGGYNVVVAAPMCNYAASVEGYTASVGEQAPEDSDWELRATVTDPLGGATVTVVQGVSIRMLSGRCAGRQPGNTWHAEPGLADAPAPLGARVRKYWYKEID